MIHLTNDFHNKLAVDIKAKYFPNENHGTSDNQKYRKTLYSIELFSNGCINYQQLIGRLAKNCQTTTEIIHSITKKYIVSFGGYKPTFK